MSLESRAGVPWPNALDANRLVGTNLFPSFSLYRGWDTDPGLRLDTNGLTIDQEHTFNNRGNIEWAEDVIYLIKLPMTVMTICPPIMSKCAFTA